MSTCNTTTSATNCPCDDFEHPAQLSIDAGQTELTRQVATFSEFRRAMLLNISEYGPLADWKAEKEEDLGVMLIEMWAYVCDVLSFYDGVIAHESYLRTARLRPSVRKLVDLLGYIPRPATGATVTLAALASGRQSVNLPEGTKFRSKAFDGEAPQVFELDADTDIHPFINKLELARTPYSTLGSYQPSTLTVLPVADLPAETLVFIANASATAQSSAEIITEESTFTGDDGEVYTQLTFGSSTRLQSSALLVDLSIYKPNNTAPLWTLGSKSDAIVAGSSGSTSLISLDRRYSQLKAGAKIIVQVDDDYYAAVITTISESEKTSATGSAVEINGSSFELPDTKVSVTTITITNHSNLRSALNALSDLGTVTVHFGMRLAAKITREPQKTIEVGADLDLVAGVEEPNDDIEPSGFLLEDKNKLGVAFEGGLNASKDALDVPDQSAWTDTFYAPVSVYANVINASRGESVKNEVLGSGSAAAANQQFKLKKKALTYFLSTTSDNDQGVSNTLQIYVDGIEWTEVTSFYLSGENDTHYIVRQNDEGDSIVTFGDGVRGARLPTGSGNVIANYRFGAGAATPPAGAINQIGKPVAGLQSIVNPVAAVEGADAEDEEEIRSYAPQSILILGRAVSMKDMEAVAESIPGVHLAQAEWRWSETSQQATAHVWYVGEANLAESIESKLRSVTEASTPFTIQVATARSIALTIDVAYDSSYEPTALAASIDAILMTEKTGFLMPENLGIGQHFFRSQLFAAILAVPGINAVQNILWLDSASFSYPLPFSSYAKRQHAGSYWDFETYTPTINLYEDSL